jgi:hypothetical protein
MDMEEEFEQWWNGEFEDCPPDNGAGPWARLAWLACSRRRDARIRELEGIIAAYETTPYRRV